MAGWTEGPRCVQRFDVAAEALKNALVVGARGTARRCVPPRRAVGGRRSGRPDGLVEAWQRGERVGEGHTLRLLAHPDRGEVDIAEVHYREALVLTEPLGLRPLIAHCHLGLGKLSLRTGKREQARDYLTTARRSIARWTCGSGWRRRARRCRSWG